MKIKREAQWIERLGPERIIQWLAPLVEPSRLARLREVVARRRTDLTLLLDRFYDPHNNAAVLRSAEAFGLERVHVVPGEQGAGFSRSVTQGVEKWIEVHLHDSTEAALDAAEAEGYVLWGADAGGEPVPEGSRGRVCLVMGAEKPGLSELARSRCARLVSVPMVGLVESLNVSVAAALLSQALCRQPPELLSGPEQRRLLACYLMQSVARPDTVLRALEERR